MIEIQPNLLFQGDVYSYGITYQNSFEKKNKIVGFEDVLQHLETVRYSPSKPEAKGTATRWVPFWKPNWIAYYRRFGIEKIISKVRLGKPEEHDWLRPDVAFLNGKNQSVDLINKAQFLEKMREHVAQRNASEGFTQIRKMTLLSKKVFQEDPAFKIDYVIDNTNCDSDLFTGGANSCLASFSLPSIASKDSELGVYNKKMFEFKLKTFLRKRSNQRIVYRSIESDQALFESDPAQRASSSPKNAPNSRMLAQSGARQKPKRAFSVSPRVIAKQVNSVLHLSGSIFIVLVKRSFLALYDKEHMVLFYVYEIEESQFHAELATYNRKLFYVRLRRAADDSQYFKILIFYFDEDSMRVLLVNTQQQLIKHVSQDIVCVDNHIYLFVLKANFLGLVVFRFKLQLLDSGDELGVSKKNLEAQCKQIVFLDRHFTDVLVIEAYQRKLKQAKIGCREQTGKGISCVLQFDSLDNLFVQFLIYSSSGSAAAAQMAQADSKSAPKFASKKAKRKNLKTWRKLRTRILVKKLIAKPRANPLKTKKRIFKSKDSDPLKVHRRLRSRDKPDSAQPVNTLWKLSLLNSKYSNVVSLCSLRLVKNPNDSRLVLETRNYFFKDFLVLAYRLQSVVRVFFYHLQSATEDSSLCRRRIQIAPISFAASRGAATVEFVDLFYRLELDLRESAFLDLQFSEQVRLTEKSSRFGSLTEHFEVVSVLRVVFDDRVETFKLSSRMRVFIKNRRLDFAKLRVFARNHLQKKEGNAL